MIAATTSVKGAGSGLGLDFKERVEAARQKRKRLEAAHRIWARSEG